MGIYEVYLNEENNIESAPCYFDVGFNLFCYNMFINEKNPNIQMQELEWSLLQG